MKSKSLENPLVSVLMTTYNREKYLAEAIESVLSSCYGNFELLVVDDQSTDRSVEIAERYAKKDNRVKSIVNDKNLGDYLNRNKAASLAKGKYLKYVDADDLIYPNGLKIMVNAMEQFPEAGFGLSSLAQDVFRIFPFQLSGREAYSRHYLEQKLFHKAPLSSIIRKDAFQNVGGFSGKRYLGDFEMWHILASNFPVVLMQHGVVWYRKHEEQEMQNNRTDATIPFKYLMCSEEYLMKNTCPLTDEDKEIALKKVRWNKARYILGVGKNKSLKTMKELKKEANYSYFKLFKLVLNEPKY